MRISSSWRFPQVPGDDLMSCLSPDGRIICTGQRSSADFYTTEKTFSIPLNLAGTDTIRCIASVYFKPWVLCVGTSGGNLVFFTPEGKQFSVKAYNGEALFVKSCTYKKSPFTEPFDVVFAQFTNQVAATIKISEILDKLANSASEVNVAKWKLTHKGSVDAVVLNSSLPSPIFSGMNKFPAVFSVGGCPFISVDSVSATTTRTAGDIVMKAVSSLWKFVAGTPEDEEQEEQVPNARSEWDLRDEGRRARNVTASEQGRWLAITDTKGRVSIVDGVFGHITRVVKGLRDAQVAWSHEMLVVFAPARSAVVLCTVPNGQIIHAAKVDKKGRLCQTIDENGNFQAVFIDSSGNAGLIEHDPADTKPSQKDTHEPYHFSLPSFMNV